MKKMKYTKSEFDTLFTFFRINTPKGHGLFPNERRKINNLGVIFTIYYNAYDHYVWVRGKEWRAIIGFVDGWLAFSSPANSITGDRAAFERDLLFMKMAYE